MVLAASDLARADSFLLSRPLFNDGGNSIGPGKTIYREVGGTMVGIEKKFAKFDNAMTSRVPLFVTVPPSIILFCLHSNPHSPM